MRLNELTDEELMQLYQNGSVQAFVLLYARHSSKVFGFLKKRIKRDEKVNDIYQEVFIKIHRSKHLYNKSLPVLPWIFTVTKTVMIDELAKDKSSKYVQDFNFDLLSAVPIQSIGDTQELNAMIRKLPDTQKHAVQMRFVDEKTFDEIAKTLKTSPTNVRQIISRGVKRLRALMSEGGKS